MRIAVIFGIILSAGCCEQPGRADARAQERALPDRAKPIVLALYRFYHERGLWPQNLDELDPDYLKRDQSRGWVYQPFYSHNGRWILSKFSGDFDEAVRLIHGWVNAFTHGLTNEDLIAGFIASPKYFNGPQKGKTDEADWVASAIQDVLQRPASAADFATYGGALE
ncbi:MAG TPA: hypothetical protein VGY58_09825 [Gemmataceae bacterium]|nr:hypothetical protein [Gemmataceae bacterium]